MKSDKARRALRSFGFKLISISLIFIGLAVIVDLSLSPLIETANTYECSNIVTAIINNAVNEELSRTDISYSNLVDLTSNTDGEVVSVESNIVNINLLKTGVSERIEREMQRMSMIDIAIPIGTITGLQFLQGKGFDIGISLIPMGHSVTRIISEFSEAGINQTRHRIIVDISARVEAIVPGYSSEVTVHTAIVAAETIIIGRVPEAYTHVVSSDGELVGTLEDYEADYYATDQ